VERCPPHSPRHAIGTSPDRRPSYRASAKAGRPAVGVLGRSPCSRAGSRPINCRRGQAADGDVSRRSKSSCALARSPATADPPPRIVVSDGTGRCLGWDLHHLPGGGRYAASSGVAGRWEHDEADLLTRLRNAGRPDTGSAAHLVATTPATDGRTRSTAPAIALGLRPTGAVTLRTPALLACR
jgi:hypothetical protein